MPSAGIHMGVAKKYYMENELSFNEDLYMIGNICPDSFRNSELQLDKKYKKKISHYYTDHKHDYEYFYKTHITSLDDEIIFGYLMHLMVDSYWYTNDLTTLKEKRENINDSYHENICKVTSKICKDMDIKEIKKLKDNTVLPFYELQEIITPSGINKTIDYVNECNSVNIDDDTTYFVDMNDLYSDINKTSNFVKCELERLDKKYNHKQEYFKRQRF